MNELVPLVKVKQAGMAKIFVRYLQSQGIDADSGPSPSDSATSDSFPYIIYCQADKQEQAKSEFSDFVRNPNQAKFQESAWQSGSSVNIRPASKLSREIQQNLKARAGWFTLSIFALCWVVYVYSLVAFDPAFAALKFNVWGDLQQTMDEPWRWLTPALFHFSFLHIAFNTLWWWQLGGQIEQHLGVSRIILLFLASAIISNTAQFYVSGPNFGGLSGVVYATVGFVWWFGYLNPGHRVHLEKPVIGFLLFWLVLGFTDFMPINVANTAHLTGLLTGIGYAFIVHARQRGGSRSDA
ncbi:rhomboid family intramembrane serine protease GlpG [Thalassotalea mangrovi]|uniref:Rhomboid family intramembrane serine protease GlpG n=1 Tax=Thalassotalea mangrovi TaxID=2572245 RepID=A0A4V5NX92_9GAMM|nr:rhomboid family intramembrane serine protease GlpG [Thalassotalea mangrovi]TKB45435.1 rhomboid family intramembrane serine protease GlpG [Thalassotalea mangrovi]